jgi:hypothetical protein
MVVLPLSSPFYEWGAGLSWREPNIMNIFQEMAVKCMQYDAFLNTRYTLFS